MVVKAGGFVEATTVKSSDPELDISFLRADHEEADTRLILHCVHARMETMVVSARDTNVLLLLLAHYDKMGCTRLYMKAGTWKEPKYFPVHAIREVLSADQIDTLLAFHAVTGCDSVSQFCGHGKKTAWQVFQKHHKDLADLGKGNLTENTVVSAEKFICKMAVLRLIHATKHESSCFVLVEHKRISLQHLMQQNSTSCVPTTRQVSGTRPTYSILIFPQ